MHACINCDGACYCHGDIDDCEVETREYSRARCIGCGCDNEADSLWDTGEWESDIEDDGAEGPSGMFDL